MATYHFETREFGVSDSGVHMLRNGFNYETIEYSVIKRLTVERGKVLNNWIAIFVFGLLLVAFALFYGFRLFGVMTDSEVDTIYIEEIVVPVLPLLIGGYCLYSSTRNGTILIIETLSDKRKRFPLEELEEENNLQAFEAFLKGKLNNKVSVSVS